MMLSIAISPRALLPPDSDAGLHFYSLLILLLRDLAENVTVVVDGEPSRVTRAAILSAVETWPHRYRIAAMEIFSRLRSRNRFVAVSDVIESGTCQGRDCRYTAGIASKAKVDAILTRSDCESVVRTSVPEATEVLTPQNYSLSQFSNRRASNKRHCVANGEMKRCEASEQLFAPMMRFAKRVTIVDRYIGRSMVGQQGSGVAMGHGYQSSLSWLYDLFCSASPPGSNRIFEVWCGIDDRSSSPKEISDAAVALRDWAARTQKPNAPSLKVWIKRESHSGEIQHARYFITDQIAVLVERGFELLHGDAFMRARSLPLTAEERLLRDCDFVWLDDAGSVLAAVRRLHDVP